jgi:hypothetical protein
MPSSTETAVGPGVSEALPAAVLLKDETDSRVLDMAREHLPQVSPPSSVANLHRSATSSNRVRVLSLDRGQDLMVGAEVHGGRSDDDDNSTVTSDGESSYFAKHLPSPKSGRISYTSDAGSTSSAPARTGQWNASISRESNASLSFSDDEDEEQDARPIFPPSVPLPSDDLQFRGIARMHSASSLVSTHDNPHSGEFEKSEAELQHIGTSRRLSENSKRPHDNPGHAFFATKSPQPLQPSPPTILSQFPAMAGTLHPQAINPHPMQAWMSAGNAAASYGSIDKLSLSMNSATDDSKGSHGTVTMVYSEDEETVEAIATEGSSSAPGGGRGVFRGVHAGSHRKPVEGDARDVGAQGASISREGSRGVIAARGDGAEPEEPSKETGLPSGFKVYWRRWLMLFYMSLLNLLSDWTCYSVAPIAHLTSEAFGSIDPEQLVVVFLVANAVATACEPILLARLGLRRTVIFGALLLMLGSIVKSGGLAPIVASNLEKGKGEWRVYLGFFLVGLSQPLYQCTPALLSASWFPEKERTLATGVALNSNQLGIGCAFAFGTLLVGSSDDIVPYFGLLSIISTITFIGTFIQFDDAPPTPPSDTAKVMRGTMEWKLPNRDDIWQSVRNFGNSNEDIRQNLGGQSGPSGLQRPAKTGVTNKSQAPRRRTGTSNRTRQSNENDSFRPGPAPSSASSKGTNDRPYEASQRLVPSPMMPGPVAPKPGRNTSEVEDQMAPYDDMEYTEGPDGQGMPPGTYHFPQEGTPAYGSFPSMHADANPYVGYPNMLSGQHYALSHQQAPHYHPQYWEQPYQRPYQHGVPMYDSPHRQAPMIGYFQADPYYYPPNQYPPNYQPYYYEYDERNISLAPPSFIEEYAEPTLTITDHHLDINIRDDQVLLSVKACMARSGFIHALVTFTVSGIVINTLSTYMDYLVRLNGAGREYVGIVGGSFQVVIMISSLIVGKQTDKTRAYYSVTIAMLVLGAFALAECGVSLDADRGGDLRWSLIVVAALVGPLQPVSTELGVEVVFPLSENTVLVIQQLFSNLLSAMFIPFFKALRDVGTERISATELYERPQYTFSFYLLIVLHAGVTVFFATFNGRYLRYERELVRQEGEKRAQEKAEIEAYEQNVGGHWNSQYGNHVGRDDAYTNERQPLVTTSHVV